MPAAAPPFDKLPPEEQAATFHHQFGFTSARRVALVMDLRVEYVEALTCRSLATLLSHGHPPEQLCATSTLTPAQLSPCTAPAFSLSETSVRAAAPRCAPCRRRVFRAGRSVAARATGGRGAQRDFRTPGARRTTRATDARDSPRAIAFPTCRRRKRRTRRRPRAEPCTAALKDSRRKGMDPRPEGRCQARPAILR